MVSSLLFTIYCLLICCCFSTISRPSPAKTPGANRLLLIVPPPASDLAPVVPYSEGRGLLGPNGHSTARSGPNGAPAPGRPPVWGYHGQDCTPDTGDYPDKCPLDKTKTPPHPIMRPVHGTMGCQHNFDCCTCRTMLCSPNCEAVNCNGDSGCFGVKDIILDGSLNGADILCNGDLSCMGTKMVGHNIRTIDCTGDGSCAYSDFNLTCLNIGCPLSCVGDNACEAHPTDLRRPAIYNIRNAAGMTCSHDSCRYATYNLLPGVGGSIRCGGEMACVGAIITTENVAGLWCGGERGCQDAKILIFNPQQGFDITCTGFNACENMKIEIIVTDPEITSFRAITCAGRFSCRGMIATITKELPRGAVGDPNLVIEELSCAAQEACKNAVFDLGHTVSFGSCACAPLSTQACKNVIGIDTCLQGLDKLECVGANSCQGLTETIKNPANDFEVICGDPKSCTNFKLNIELDGRISTTHFKGITCGAANSCIGLEVSIVNTGANLLDAGMVNCAGANACKNAKFGATFAEFSSFLCGDATSCEGCKSTVDNVCNQCGTTDPCKVAVI